MRARAALAAIVGMILAVAAMFTAVPAQAASLQQITGWGANPTNLKMYLYVPTTVTAHPAILVGVHWCHGDASAFYTGTGYAQLADKYGFIVIYPSVTRSDGCWDVGSTQALKRDGGSDPVGIKAMLDWTVKKYNGDTSRVFVTGHSSGGMMTNVLLGDYPDVFKAGAASAGVPFSCFSSNAGPPTGTAIAYWNTGCANGTITKTAQQWGDAVRAADPGYTGVRPRMQLWHGTADATLNFHNFGEEIKQWSNVAGISQTPTTTDSPATDRTRTQYKASNGSILVEGNQIQNGTHNIPINATDVVHFFGLDGSNPIQPPGTTTSPTAAPTTAAPTTKAPSPTPTTVKPTTVKPTTAAPTTTTTQPTTGSGATTTIVGSQSGRCLDIPASETANGTAVELWDCNGGTNQNWTLTSSNQLQVLGKCLDVAGQGTTSGSKVQLWDCNGQTNQQWTAGSNGTITAGNSGLCLDAANQGTINGTTLQVWTCNGQSNQKWTRS